MAIAGPPNAGKSTLLNRIARREAAIVSPIAGTTRDIIEVHLDLDGWPVTLLDTAGIRETDDAVEMEGVRRARERAGAADLVLWLAEATGQGADEKPAAAPGQEVWLVRNKIDLVQRPGQRATDFQVHNYDRNEYRNQKAQVLISNVKEGIKQRNEYEFVINEQVFDTSALTGAGLEPLLAALAEKAKTHLAPGESVLITRERHRRGLEDTVAALRRALTRPVAEREDLLAEELRIAATALGRLTGRVDVEDILDVIFRDFCIGK